MITKRETTGSWLTVCARLLLLLLLLQLLPLLLLQLFYEHGCWHLLRHDVCNSTWSIPLC